MRSILFAAALVCALAASPPVTDDLTNNSELIGRQLTQDEPTGATTGKKPGRAPFFASRPAAESEKAPVGTFHATGKFKEELEAENDRSGDWACTKCHYTNFKECLTCARCRSLRRFEGRNQASGYCQ